jgi:hypothetical protein
MNNHFSFLRYCLLLRKYLKENSKSFILILIAGFGIIFLVYGIMIVSSFHSSFPEGSRKIVFTAGLLFGGTLFSASFYSFFSTQAKGIQYLLLPATNGEKLLIGFFFTQIVYLSIYLLGFMGIDFLLCNIYNKFVAIPDWVPEWELQYFKAKYIYASDTLLLKEMIVIYFILTSIAHFGSLSFTKNAYVKTSIIFIVLLVGVIYINNKMLEMIIPEKIMPHGKYFQDSFRIGPTKTPTGIIALPESWQTTVIWFIPIFLYISFWTASYFKLKEKQV